MVEDRDRGFESDVFGLGRLLGGELQRTVENGEAVVNVRHSVDAGSLESAAVRHTVETGELDLGTLLSERFRRRLEVGAICFLALVVAVGTLTPASATVQIAASLAVVLAGNVVYRQLHG